MDTKHKSDYAFSLKKIKNEKGGLLGALRHNKRRLPPESHIKSSKSHLNYSLLGNDSPDAIFKQARKSMIDAGIDSPRKNAVLAVEVIFSLPISWHDKDTRQFFEHCFEWVCKNLPGEKLSFDVHLDESAPHAHALILPLINGRMQGSDMVGGTGNIMRLIKLFNKDVGIYYGLGKLARRRLSNSDKTKLRQSVLSKLKSDSVQKSAVWPLVRDSVHQNPEPYAELLAICYPAPALKKSFVEYKRFRGHGSFIK